MAKRNLITTARGAKLDMDALKALQPQTKRLLINHKSTKKVVPLQQINAVPPPKARLHATKPSPVPNHYTVIFEEINKNDEIPSTASATPVKKHKTPNKD